MTFSIVFIHPKKISFFHRLNQNLFRLNLFVRFCRKTIKKQISAVFLFKIKHICKNIKFTKSNEDIFLLHLVN